MKPQSKTTKNPFTSVDVQLVKLIDYIPKGEWLWELKYDGYRVVVFVECGNVRLITRGGMDYTKKFQPIADSIYKWKGERAFVLDGELIVVDENGKSDFNALQNYSSQPQPERLVYVAFDILSLDGIDLRPQPLLQRKKLLSKLMKDSPHNIRESQFIKNADNARDSFATVCFDNHEGLIAKQIDSPYVGSRNGSWVKLKCQNYER